MVIVPTHGDWQPRNWLMDGTELRIIDFGRYGYRPATSDFCRLAVQQWRTAPQLESAFFEGVRFRSQRQQTLERHAAARGGLHRWAYHVGDDEFEEQGHRMLRDALANF